MDPILTRAIAYIFTIVLAYSLKRLGMFKPTDYKILAKIVLNVTLPATIIANFSQLTIEPNLLFVLLIGFSCNVILVSLAYFLSRKQAREKRAFFMLNSAGFNVGCFTLPYAQSALGPLGVVTTCLFDSGNSIMCLGTTYSLAKKVATGSKASIIKSLLTTVPFLSYMFALTLALIGITLPQPIIDISFSISDANGFCSMFMIGMMLEIKAEKQYIKDLLLVLILRFSFASLAALFFYFCLPFPLLIRQTLVLVAFSPISIINPIFTGKLKGNVEAAGAVNSFSTVIAIVCITILMTQMQLI